MIAWLRRTLTENDNEPGFADILRRILIVVFVVLLLIAITQTGIVVGTLKSDILIVLAAVALLNLLFIYLAYKNILWPGKLFLPIFLLGATIYTVITANGLHDIAMTAFPAVVFMTSVLFGKRLLILWWGITTACIAFIGYWDMAGYTPEPIARTTGIDTIATGIFVTLAATGLAYLLQRRFEGIVQQVRQSENEQIKVNQELRELQVSLEERIEERTMALEHRSSELSNRTVQLELSNIRTQRRAAQLQAISDVTKAIATVHKLVDLLPRITKVVSERFNYYHVGIFLTDDARQFAILSATNSEGGKRMLARGHRLEVGAHSIVGYVIANGTPRIALDTGSDSIYFNNPDLPNTRSEMAIPLETDRHIIGALDIQSTQANAFSQEDIEVLSTLADQITIAIQNSRQFESTQKSIAEAETLYRQFLRQEWKASTPIEVAGFRYSVSGATPIEAGLQDEVIRKVSSNGETVMKTGENARIAIPIKLRDEVIGVLNVRMPGKTVWKNDEINVIQAVANRVAISAENARLFADSQKRAAKEQVIGEISAKIGASVNLENIFRTAMQELYQLMPDTEIIVEFQDENKNE